MSPLFSYNYKCIQLASQVASPICSNKHKCFLCPLPFTGNVPVFQEWSSRTEKKNIFSRLLCCWLPLCQSQSQGESERPFTRFVGWRWKFDESESWWFWRWTWFPQLLTRWCQSVTFDAQANYGCMISTMDRIQRNNLKMIFLLSWEPWPHCVQAAWQRWRTAPKGQIPDARHNIRTGWSLHN